MVEEDNLGFDYSVNVVRAYFEVVPIEQDRLVYSAYCMVVVVGVGSIDFVVCNFAVGSFAVGSFAVGNFVVDSFADMDCCILGFPGFDNMVVVEVGNFDTD